MLDMFKVATADGAKDAIAATLASGMLGEGPRVVEFAERLTALFGNYTLPLNSGTSALTLALRLAGVGHGDKVISTPLTMVATSCAIAASGAKIIWSDVCTTTFSSRYKNIVELIDNHQPKAVMITCVSGVPPLDLDLIRKACLDKNVPLILDCAHGFVTEYLGVHISNWADYCCFSFQSIKHLSTGDGGAITLHPNLPEEVYARAEKLKWFGMTRIVPEGKTRLQHQMTADVPEWGYKYHMNDITASIGLANWDLALANVEISRRNANLYQQYLSNIPGISLQTSPDASNPSWWVYGILVPAEFRNDLIAYLLQNEVVSTPMWRRNDMYSTFERSNAPSPGMDMIQDRILFLPSGWWVSESDVSRVANLIQIFMGERA